MAAEFENNWYTTRVFNQDDKTIVHYQQDTEPMVEVNKTEYTDHSDWRPYAGKDMVKVASIPAVVAIDLHKRFNFLGQNPDWPAITRWINDPDNRHFRTAPGKV